MRLQRAKDLLLTTDLFASEVCYEVGYASLRTFASPFTQLMGVSQVRMRRDGGAERGPGRCYRRGEAANTTGARERGRPPVLHGDGLSGFWIFVGLFPGAVPQRSPVASVLLDAPGV